MGMGIRIVPALKSKSLSVFFLLSAFTLLLSPFLFGSIHDWSALSFAALLGGGLFLSPESLRVSVSRMPKVFVYSQVFILGWMLTQSFFAANDPDAARIETLKTGTYALIFCLILSQPLERVHKLSQWVVAAACLITLYGFAETFSGHEYVLWRHKEAHTGYVTGTFLNRNHFAGFLELAIALAAADFLKSQENKSGALKHYALFAVIFLIAGLFSSGSRSGMLCFLVFSVIFFGIYVKNTSKSSRWIVPAGFAVMLTVLAVLAGKTGITRYFDSEDPFTVFQSERWIVWGDTMRLFSQFPLRGIGAGNFESVFPSVQSEKLIFAWAHAHNGYLELLAELGLPTFLVFLAGWGALFSVWQKAWLRLERVKQYQFLAVCCGMGAFLLHGISDFNFSVPSNMYLFSFLAAYAVLFTKEP